jgi:uncharacterized protein YndB with AHSA1/START domain
MTQTSVTHGTFTVERTYPVSAHEVFAAWASQDAKDRWFGSGSDFLAKTDEYSLDFRVGGLEHFAGSVEDGRTFRYTGITQDIVEDERIVMSYDVLVSGRRISVSIMTVQMAPTERGSKLTITEQGAFLDGLDDNATRKLGATANLDALEAYFATATVGAASA